MKRIFFYGLTCMVAGVTACKDLRDDLKTAKETEPVVSLGFYKAYNAEPLDTTTLYADGQSIAVIKVSITPKILLSENRKIRINTTAGDFMVDGAPKKAIDTMLDEDSELEVVLRFAQSAGPGLITFSTEKNLEQRKLFFSFKKALPDEVFLETPNFSLKDTSENMVTARLVRNIGIPSKNQLLLFELLTADGIRAQNASFINTSLSDSAGISKTNLILKGQAKGVYRILAKLPNDTKIYGSHEIRIVD